MDQDSLIGSMLKKYMAKMQEKEDVSSSMNKVAIENCTYVSFSATHPIRALGSKWEPINTFYSIHHGNRAKVDAAINSYSLGDGKTNILAKVERERRGNQATEKSTPGLEMRGIPGSGLPLVAASLVLHAST